MSLVSSPPVPAFKQMFKYVTGVDRDPGRTFHACIDIASYGGYSFFGPSPLEGETTMMQSGVPNVNFSGPSEVPDDATVAATFEKLSQFQPTYQGSGFTIPDELKQWVFKFVIDLLSKLFQNPNPAPMPG